jgi:C1A family cysteine protease
VGGGGGFTWRVNHNKKGCFMPRKIKRYGWIPDLPDHRDLLYFTEPARVATLPPKVDLRSQCPSVYNQGQLGSCTANAIAAAHEFEQRKQNLKTAFTPSRLFIYYNERVIEHTVAQDAGAMIRDGIKSAVKQGVCPEKEWPYRITAFSSKPTASCYRDALLNQVLNYQRLTPTLLHLKDCLAAGFPFVFGFSVYESFESESVVKTGKVPLPKPAERLLGGHAVLAVGYDDKNQCFIVRNSWGADWGLAGYCWMPYAYLTNPTLSSDFWTIRVVEGEGKKWTR